MTVGEAIAVVAVVLAVPLTIVALAWLITALED